MQIVSKILFIIIIALFAQQSVAEETRISILANSNLIKNLEKDGKWITEASDYRIIYNCNKCTQKIIAMIEVTPFQTFQKLITNKQTYITRRKAYCANLASDFNGKCIQTRRISMRGDGLSGYQSEQEVYGKTEVEIIFFHHDFRYGPETIKTIISIEKGKAFPHDIIGLFLHHMAKLTIFF